MSKKFGYPIVVNRYSSTGSLSARGVPDNKSDPVSGRILGKCPVRYPAALFTMSGRILSQNNNLK